MLAANIWHWWIAVVLVIVSVGALAALGVGYLKTVTAKRYPPERSISANEPER